MTQKGRPMINNNELFNSTDLQILQRARDTYGPYKQIGVAAEECTELAKELIKSFRYDNFYDAVTNTREAVIDEVADVFIVLDHIISLYGIVSSDLRPHIRKKLDRLNYWLEHSSSIEFTTQVRSIDSQED